MTNDIEKLADEIVDELCGSPHHGIDTISRVRRASTHRGALEMAKRLTAQNQQQGDGCENVPYMPKELTAENGAKGLLSGEFFEEIKVPCIECYADDGVDDDCLECFGSGELSHKVLVSWTTIKEIYAKAEMYFSPPQASQPQEEEE